MFQSTKISGNLKSAIKKNQHLKSNLKIILQFFEIFGPQYYTARSISPGDMGNFERYEMGAFPLRDGHFENLARASAYPLGWASGQVLLSSGVGCLGTAQKRKLFNLLGHCFNRCFGVPFSVLRKVDYDVNCVTVHVERLLIMKQ